MRVLRVIGYRLRSLLSGDRLDDEAREEIAAHLERQIAANRATGMSDDEARRAALLEVGQVPQLGEACRDARGLAWWDALRSDTRYAVRQMRKRPGFSAAAVVTLALGVGATAAVFAVVDTVLLRPLPYAAPDRLYALYEINTRGNVGRTRATALNFLDWQQQASSFSGMAAHVGTGFTLTGRGEPEFALGQLVTPGLLEVLGVQPMLGRGFQPNETEAGRNRVVILTHALWMRHFGGDPSVVGRPSSINGQPYLVIGVMPPSFTYPAETYQLMTPLVTKGNVSDGPPISRSARYLRVVARLRDGVREESARQELAVVGGRLSDTYADSNATVTIGMAGLAEDMTAGAQKNLVIVLVAVGFVLLIACVNVAGLTIARGSARGRELSVRAAIGASRGRLVRQLATEGLVLFIIGGAIGLTLAAWGVAALASELPASLPRAAEISVHWRFLAFGAALTLVSGLLFSVLPALSIARQGPASGLAGARGTVSGGRAVQRTRGILIAAQIAAAVVLLAGAALALRSFDRVRKADKGFETARTMTFGFVIGDRAFPRAADMKAFAGRTVEALEAAPAVEAAGLTTHLPLADNNLENTFTVDGSPVEAGQDPPIAGVRGVSGHYRTAIGARLLQGRDLLPSDTERAQPVVVVTADFANRYVRGASPLGVRVKMGGADSSDPWRTIVGVIADIRHGGLDQEARPEVWMPYAQLPDDLAATWLRGLNVAARTSMDPEAAMPALRAAMRALDAHMPLMNVRTLDELASESTAERRLETSLLAAFASIALVLAAVGLFAVLAFYVAQHMQEFGVRLALGATPQGLLGLVIRRGLVLLAMGIALGLPAALAMGRGMSTLLYGVEPADPVALGGAVALLSAVTLAACAVPARRAMKTDPLVALRND
ncbi:MAG: ABC transporter permease [Acidobacteriota bacterium]|nr:ABC transporter permease [Acidobacteriota bacterium]